MDPKRPLSEPRAGGVSEDGGAPSVLAPGRSRARVPRRLLLGAVPLAAAVAFLALMGSKLFRRQAFGGFGVNAVGKMQELRARPAPDFEVQLFDGGVFRLSQQRGQVVLLNFWASWCPPCRLEAPVLERTWQKYKERGFVLFGLDVWDKDDDARAFLRRYGITYPNGKQGESPIAVEYGVTGLPESFFIDRKGVLARRWIGPLTDQRIAAILEPLLLEPAGP